jgi:hypothetical protein
MGFGDVGDSPEPLHDRALQVAGRGRFGSGPVGLPLIGNGRCEIVD